ncbi:MAG: hypothetical protein IPO69_20415 [Saprospiraceae bacterium]|nr:hypothetical protein [Saprospiraceae bacterium]
MDGLKRSPPDEAECRLHYARDDQLGSYTMLTGFHYSAIAKSSEFKELEANFLVQWICLRSGEDEKSGSGWGRELRF